MACDLILAWSFNSNKLHFKHGLQSFICSTTYLNETATSAYTLDDEFELYIQNTVNLRERERKTILFRNSQSNTSTLELMQHKHGDISQRQYNGTNGYEKLGFSQRALENGGRMRTTTC